jgi:type II secretory ATPase GspE/PulE/Tfp pilus assembly ATPase PilB-like protein
MSEEKLRLGDILVKYNLISQEQLKDALEEQKKTKRVLGLVITDLGFATEDDIFWVLSKQFQIPYLTLTKDKIDFELLNLFPEKYFNEHNIIPFVKTGDEITVVTDNPTQQEIFIELEKVSGYKLNLSLVNMSNMKEIKKYVEEVEDSFKIQTEKKLEQLTQPVIQSVVNNLLEDITCSKIINFIIEKAISDNIGSVIIEPGEKNINVLFRYINYRFHQFSLPISMHKNLISKVTDLLNVSRVEVGEIYYFDYYIKADKFKIGVLKYNTISGQGFAFNIIKNLKLLPSIGKVGFSKEQIELITSKLIYPGGIYFLLGNDMHSLTTNSYSICNEVLSYKKNILILDKFNQVYGKNITQIDITEIDSINKLQLIDLISPDAVLITEADDEDIIKILKLNKDNITFILQFNYNDIKTFLRYLVKIGVSINQIRNKIRCIILRSDVERLCENCKKEINVDDDYLKKFEVFQKGELKFKRKVGCSLCYQLGFSEFISLYEVLKFDNFVISNLKDEASIDTVFTELENRGYVGIKRKIMTKVISGEIPFNTPGIITHT